MYTDKEIANRKTKVHPAIIMPTNWITVLDDEEFNKKWDVLKSWAIKKKEYFQKKYGEENVGKLMSLITPKEITPFLRAGFELDFDYLDDLIENCTIKKNAKLLEQEIVDILLPIRESMTTITLCENGIWGAQKEFKDNYKTKQAKIETMINLAKTTLPLLAGKQIGYISYLSEINEAMQKDCGKKIPPTDTFIKALQTVKDTVNENVYSQINNNGFINYPEVN